MISIKEWIRDFLPHGLVGIHRRKFRLKRLGLSKGRFSKSELDVAAKICRFELWPKELRYAPHDWTLVDVGANVGDFVSAALKLVSPEQIIAIEPLPSCHEPLKTALKASSNSLIIKAVAGETTDEVEMHVTGDSKMSSVLLPLKEIESAYGPRDSAVLRKLRVSQVRIDEVVPVDCRVGLLKLDVQGYELCALRGAEDTLKRTGTIMVEINYIPHYQGGDSFEDVHAFLIDHGFRLHGVSSPYCGNGRPLWADAIYSRPLLS